MSSSPSPSRLPDERIGAPSVRRVVGLVLGLVLAVLGVNLAAGAFLDARGTNRGYRILDAKYALLDRAAGTEPVDWLILGDSSGTHGIDPAVWTSVTGGTALNLAIVANLLVNNDLWMLREYIDRVGVPEHVVLVHAFDIWDRGYNTALLGKLPRPWGYWNTPPQVPVKAAHLHRVAVSRYLPLYAEAGTLQSSLARWLAGQPDPFHMRPTGWVPPRAHSSSHLGRDTARAVAHIRKRQTPYLSSHNLRALKVLAWLSEQYDVEAYLVHAPMGRAAAATPGFSTYVERLDDRLVEHTKDAPKVHVVRDVWVVPERHLERTVDHPGPAAVPAFTLFTAAMVKEAERAAGE